MDSFSLYLVNPYNITRGAVQFAAAIVVEYFQARRQRTRDIQPRIGRGMPFPVLKAATTTLMRDMTTDLIIGEMYRGTPIVYADYLGYDEVAHHAGPERPEAMDQLDRVDRMVRSLSRAAREAPRAYHFIILSDHGQTQGAPFADRYGVALEDLVRELMTGEVDEPRRDERRRGLGSCEHVPHGGLAHAGQDREPHAARDAQQDDGRRRELRSRRRPTQEREARGQGRPGGPRPHRRGVREPREHLLHRGPRAHDPRGHRDPPSAAAPRARQPRGHRLRHGPQRDPWPLAIGRRGVRFLSNDTVDGDDPIAVFGPHTADNLRRLDGFQHVGDILVISMYDPSTEEIAPFEHQVGAHGGLGDQTKAFVLYPSALERQVEPVSLVGAPSVNAKLHEWIARARELDAMGATEAAGEAEAAPLPSVLQGARAED